MTKHFLEHMKEKKSGHIVSLASMAGLSPSPHIAVYSATKFGVQGFMASLNEHLRLEKFHNIKTSTIFPYYIKTRNVLLDFLDTK
jgi:short-subunit dehydrogenase